MENGLNLLTEDIHLYLQDFIRNRKSRNNLLDLVCFVHIFKKTHYWHEVYCRFINEGRLSPRFRQMLWSVSDNTVLASFSNQPYLPNSLKILHELAVLPDGILNEYIASGLIHKNMSYLQARQIRYLVAGQL